MVSKDGFRCSKVLLGDGHSQRGQAILKGAEIFNGRYTLCLYTKIKVRFGWCCYAVVDFPLRKAI